MFKVPKKYQAAIKEVYQDEDGIWCILTLAYLSRLQSIMVGSQARTQDRNQGTELKQGPWRKAAF